MKRILLLALFICLFTDVASAQVDSTITTPKDTSYWKRGGQGTLNFSQVSLSNWAQGGESSLALQGIFNLFAKYEQEKNRWETSLDGAYGIVKSGAIPTRKSDDKIDFNSKYGRQTASNKLFYSALFNFKSQFAPGYNYPNTSNVIANFMAPGYFLLSMGMDYLPNPDLSFYLSPFTGKMTVVFDPTLAKAGAFGVDSGKHIRIEPGAYFTMKYKHAIMENVTLNTKLDLFSNYLVNPQNVDVNWDVLISMKVNKYLSASVNATMIYDDDIQVPVFEDVAGVKTQVGSGPRLQFKEVIGIGLSYKF